MTMRALCTTVAAGCLVLALSGCQDEPLGPNALAPDGELAARGGEKGGNGGGNGGADKETGDLFSDLTIILRDVNGVPIVYPEVFTDERGNEIYCVQPVSGDLAIPHPDAIMGVEGAPATVAKQINAVSGRQVTKVPIYAQYQQYLPEEEEEETDPHGDVTIQSDEGDLEIAPGPCDIIVLMEPVVDGNGTVVALDTIWDYTQYADEVELERLNMARAPDRVLRKQMQEVELLFRSSDPSLVTLDPAGRPVFDGTMVDAMPKLQGIHEALLETGTIPGATAFPQPFKLVSPGFTGWTTWAISAFALGGSASKFGRISIDAVSYHDRVMGIPVDGSWEWTQYKPFQSPELQEFFVNYSGFTYDRATTYPGCVTYADLGTLDWVVGKIRDVVEFTDLGPGVPAANNIAGYAQMADDARAVIFWIHEHGALIGYADPVGINTCEAQGYTGP